MSWEIDLFGKITSRVKESKWQREATKAQYNSAMVSLCAEIVTQYCALSLLPRLQSSIDVTINAIAVLLGVYPADIAHKLQYSAPLPNYKHLVGAGVPMDLLRRVLVSLLLSAIWLLMLQL